MTLQRTGDADAARARVLARITDAANRKLPAPSNPDLREAAAAPCGIRLILNALVREGCISIEYKHAHTQAIRKFVLPNGRETEWTRRPRPWGGVRSRAPHQERPIRPAICPMCHRPNDSRYNLVCGCGRNAAAMARR